MKKQQPFTGRDGYMLGMPVPKKRAPNARYKWWLDTLSEAKREALERISWADPQVRNFLFHLDPVKLNEECIQRGDSLAHERHYIDALLGHLRSREESLAGELANLRIFLSP